MKYLLSCALALSVCVTALADDKKADLDSAGFKFTDVKIVKTTSVKDQNKSGTCWCFAGTSHFEDEIIKASGDSLDLSEMFTVRYCYLEKAIRYVRMYGSTAFSPGGSILDVPYVWEKYGAIPEEVYNGLGYGEEKHNHGELHAVLSAYMRSVEANPNKKLTTAWKKGLEGILDAYFGEIPETFTYKGKTYTPKSYAKSLGLVADNYIAVSSFTHHPYYKPFVLEVADNWLWGQYQNVPMEELKAIVDNAIENGYSVVWAADVSEGGFKWKNGLAVLPKGKDQGDMNATELARWVKLSDKERQDAKYKIDGPVEEVEVTQELRQEMFDRLETTDDHGMVIVGTAVDQEGNKYYKVKNSWDTNQIYDGYFYVSEPYFLAKTLSVLVNKNAIPASIAKKME
ncbi:MAG: aminopeptidase [Muribaculaceae bacterium]|nr:aminopeptidase [Muribaculaceae bacterium]MBQ9073667.1 aminopeptidase [Muribaculaceae bacterium]